MPARADPARGGTAQGAADRPPAAGSAARREPSALLAGASTRCGGRIPRRPERVPARRPWPACAVPCTPAAHRGPRAAHPGPGPRRLRPAALGGHRESRTGRPQYRMVAGRLLDAATGAGRPRRRRRRPDRRRDPRRPAPGQDTDRCAVARGRAAAPTPAQPTRRPAQTTPQLPAVRLLGLSLRLRRLQQLAAASDRGLRPLPAHRCSPAGRQLPGLLPAPRPVRPRSGDPDLDPVVARRRSGSPTRDSVRDARLRRAAPEGPTTRGRCPAARPAALRAPGRPGPRRPVRRPPGLELHHHRPVRPAALAHRHRPGAARRVRSPRPPAGMGRTGPPTGGPQPAHPARVGRRGRPHPRGRHPIPAHRPARHQRPPDPAVPHPARPGHPRPRPGSSTSTSEPSKNASRPSPRTLPANSAAGYWSCAARAGAPTQRCRSRRSASISATSTRS